MRANLGDVLRMLASIALWLVGGLIALTIGFPTITPGNALATLGLGGVAIGFAFKDTFENFLAGILILLREPFRIGDFVEVDGREGQIEEITIRDSRIRQTDGQLVVMPNHELFQNAVTVRTDTELRRVTIICPIALNEDVDAAHEAIRRAVEPSEEACETMRTTRCRSSLRGLGRARSSSKWLGGRARVRSRCGRAVTRSCARSRRGLAEADIEIPFPYRALVFRDPLRTQAANDEPVRQSD